MKGIIIYATKHGSTEKAVKLLQSKITGDIRTLNVAKETAPDLSLYDTVILGGPIYVGKMPKELSTYIQKNSEVLKTKKLALFLCAGEQDSARREALLVSSFPKELYNHAVIREVLGGELKLKKVDLFTRFILRAAMGIKEDYSRISEEKIDGLAKAIS